MTIQESIRSIASKHGLTEKPSRKATTLTRILAERKVLFFLKQKLTYSAKVTIEEEKKVVHFSEMLVEKGAGVATGDGDCGAGCGFKVETYSTKGGARSGTIQEQSTLFGKRYSYSFVYQVVREDIEKAAKDSGYAFEYHITPFH